MNNTFITCVRLTLTILTKRNILRYCEEHPVLITKTNWCHCFNFIHISTGLYMFRSYRPILRRHYVAAHTIIGSVCVPCWLRVPSRLVAGGRGNKLYSLGWVEWSGVGNDVPCLPHSQSVYLSVCLTSTHQQHPLNILHAKRQGQISLELATAYSCLIWHSGRLWSYVAMLS
jgi:hypothetical protein